MDLVFEKFESFLTVVEEIIGTKLKEAKLLLATEGKDIEDISDMFLSSSGELFDLLPDGTLVKTNLYIATKILPKEKITIKNLPRYHLYRCQTISKMFVSGRKHRYKINTRDDGKFYMLFTDSQGVVIAQNHNQKLYVCKNCLSKFLHKKYSSDMDVRNFNLQDFHKQNSSFFDFDTSSLEKGEDAKPNVYSRKWNQISTQIKIRKNYTCEDCGWKSTDRYQQRFIHTHHQNGDKTNNRKENLRVLCIECHSNVDGYHSRIKSNDNYQEFINLK